MIGSDLCWRVVYDGSRANFHYSVEWSDCGCFWHTYETYIATYIRARFLIWWVESKRITTDGNRLIMYTSHSNPNLEKKQAPK